MCSWSNTQNIEVDQLDWELTNQEVERHYSTPAEDHTLGTEKGKPGRDKQGYSDCAYCGKTYMQSGKSPVSLLIDRMFTQRVQKADRIYLKNVLKCKIDFPVHSARSLPVLSEQQPDGSQSERQAVEPSPSPDQRHLPEILGLQAILM